MAGRGRGMTLPAWMTSGAAATTNSAITSAQNNTSDIKAPPIQTSQQFSDVTQADSLPKATFSELSRSYNQQPLPVSQHSTSSHNFVAPAMTGTYSSIGNNYHPPLNGQTVAPVSLSQIPGGLPTNIHSHAAPGFHSTSQNGAPPHFPRTQSLPTQAQIPGMAYSTQVLPHASFGLGRGLPLAIQQPSLPYGTPAAMGLSHLPVPPRIAAPPMPHGGITQSSNGNAIANAIDPNNDVTNWSLHETDDKRKYWFNKVTGTSTYEKPFCLKTPEERAIPPCSWKEYSTPDGRRYYNNGKESRYNLLVLLVSDFRKPTCCSCLELHFLAF